MALLEQAEDFVQELFKDKLSEGFLYHNLGHTLSVVNSVKLMSKDLNLTDEENEQLLLAAWFHDTGYTEGCQMHEESSSKMAQSFLKEKNYPDDGITKVVSLINATHINHQPVNELEKIIKDADYSHLSKKDFLAVSELVRMELKVILNKQFTDKEWANENLSFINQHRFYSDYAIENWQSKKDRNRQKLLEKITQLETNSMEISDKEKRQKEKEERSFRTVDTMFKTTLTNHIRLSEIADSKANILLSVNAIIISVALSSIVPKLDSPGNAHLIIPTFTLVLFSVVSIIFAILSTKPKVTSGEFTRQDIIDRKVNLLFFGNFFKMPYEEFQWAVNELMKDKEYLHNSMIKDLYYLGLVLERKYRLLRITYNIFMIGIITSVIAFVIAFKHAGV
jgi:predicted metal-dependent HD superfamily phosphohydrolase